jgi:hypothetical protein
MEEFMLKLPLGIGFLVSFLLMSVLVVSAADYPPRIEVSDVKARLDSGQNVVFVDTRTGGAWSGSGLIIPGAIRIRSGQDLAAAQKTLQKDDFIVTYCT